MIRITRNDDIAFNVNEVRGKGDRYKITFYTVNNAVNIQKTDQDVTDGIITLNGSELMTIGEGVMNFRVDNIAPNAGYNDGVYNSSFTRTTKYYIVSGVIIPDGEDTETVIDLISELQDAVSTEITRSTSKDNAHDAALANVYTKAEVDDMLDDIDVVLPDNIVIDANYNHTDNNYTTTEKNKLAGIASGAEANVQSDWNVTDTSSDAYIKNKPTNVSTFTNDVGYLTSYTETDPTVPSWAKQRTKPTYTASEVGALSSSTVIPSKTSDLTNDSGFVTGSKIYVGTCTTAAATMPKVCTVETFPTDNQGKPLLGTTIAVKYTNTNTGSTNRGLDVNGTGSAPVWVNTSVSTTAGYYGTANRYITYFWDGTNWVFLTWGYDKDTTYSNVALGQGYATQNNASASTTITAALSSYALSVNGIVSVKFNYNVPANATLNINGKGAKAIYNKDAAITDGVIKAGDTATFIYNTYYRLISVDSWQDNTGGGNTQTNNTTLYLSKSGNNWIFKDGDNNTLSYSQVKSVLTGQYPDVLLIYNSSCYYMSILSDMSDGDNYYDCFFYFKSVQSKIYTVCIELYEESGDEEIIVSSSEENVHDTFYGQCINSATERTAFMSDYVTRNGNIAIVKFTYAVTAGCTLNVSSTGAKPIKYRGANITNGIIGAGDTATFVYAGTSYDLISVDKVSNFTTVGPLVSNGIATYTLSNNETYKLVPLSSNPTVTKVNINLGNSGAEEPITTIIFDPTVLPSLPTEVNISNNGTAVSWDNRGEYPSWSHYGNDVYYIVVTVYDGKYATYKEWQ